MQQIISLFKRLIFLLVFVVYINSNFTSAQSISKQIDELITSYYENDEFNGCILVAEKGNIIFEKAYGYTDHTKSKKLTCEYQFRLASVSKQFTAAAIMILQNRGMLNYDDKVIAYLKDFPYEDISIRNLLTHTSGLPDYGGLLEKYGNEKELKNSIVSNKDVYNLLIKYIPSLIFNPGEDYQYCNTGYVILALLVEKIYKKSFQEFMAENIFIPLGMNNSYINPSDGHLDKIKRAKGFKIKNDGSGFIEYDWNYQNGMYGDGGVISTIHDLVKWDKVLQTEVLFNNATLQKAFSQVVLNDGSTREYGFGWSIIKDDSVFIAAHGGGWLGYTTGILRDLKTGQTIIQLCNMPSKRVIFSLWDIVNGRSVKVPKFTRITFNVQTKIIPENDFIFISGNHSKLGNWNPAKIMFVRKTSNQWERTFSIEKGYELNYKITRGSWEKEAVYEKGIIPKNCTLKVQNDTSIFINIPLWKDLK